MGARRVADRAEHASAVQAWHNGGVRFVLHRPRSSQNIGAAARALANTGAGALWTVEPLGFDRTQAAKLAAGAGEVLDSMRVVRTLEEAVEDCVDVVMTTGRVVPGALDPRAAARRLLEAPGEAALVFGDEVNGLTNRELRRANAIATIPTAQKSSLNLAQAVLVFGYEVLLARGSVPATPPPEQLLADEKLLAILRGRARELLSRVGFLNPQQPDRALDELLQLPRRARATRREIEMLLAALDQIARNLR
jgi:tRNA/rRNA methyltransferase